MALDRAGALLPSRFIAATSSPILAAGKSLRVITVIAASETTPSGAKLSVTLKGSWR